MIKQAHNLRISH